MGLDITAYSHLAKVGHFIQPWCEDENHIAAYAYNDFPQSFRGIDVVGADAGFLHGGCFVVTDATERLRFRAGSYGGYNRWRADLQEQFNPGLDPDGPFYELIWFADNEGTIGPEAAADLLKDFENHASSYRGEGHAQRVYADFCRAAALGSHDGFVDFH